MLGSLILYLKGMRMMMFQLSGYYCKNSKSLNDALRLSEPTRCSNNCLNPSQTRASETRNAITRQEAIITPYNALVSSVLQSAQAYNIQR